MEIQEHQKIFLKFIHPSGPLDPLRVNSFKKGLIHSKVFIPESQRRMWSVFEHWAPHSSVKQDLLCRAGFANSLTVALALPCLRCVSSVQHIPSRIGRPQANLLMNYGKHRHYARCKSHICSAHQYRGLDVSRRTSPRGPRDSPGDSSERKEGSSPRGFLRISFTSLHRWRSCTPIPFVCASY